MKMIVNAYYVEKYGQDGPGRGKKETPWRTIQYAASNIKPGDVVIVGDGEYDERVTINLV